jgi:hypothetical protein
MSPLIELSTLRTSKDYSVNVVAVTLRVILLGRICGIALHCGLLSGLSLNTIGRLITPRRLMLDLVSPMAVLHNAAIGFDLGWDP